MAAPMSVAPSMSMLVTFTSAKERTPLELDCKTCPDAEASVDGNVKSKFAAKLQEYQGCRNPVLLRTEGRAGHGAGTPKDKQINQIAEIYGYALSVINK